MRRSALLALFALPFLRPTAAQPVAASGGKLTFTVSRGGFDLQIGDTWTVAITGATPKTPVTVSGSMPSGPFSGAAMGSTDAAGAFSKSGTVDAGMVGAWQETWSVGGVPSGSFSFTVARGDRCPVCGALPTAADVVWLRVSNADGTIDFGGEISVVFCGVCRVHYSPLAMPQ